MIDAQPIEIFIQKDAHWAILERSWMTKVSTRRSSDPKPNPIRREVCTPQNSGRRHMWRCGVIYIYIYIYIYFPPLPLAQTVHQTSKSPHYFSRSTHAAAPIHAPPPNPKLFKTLFFQPPHPRQPTPSNTSPSPHWLYDLQDIHDILPSPSRLLYDLRDILDEQMHFLPQLSDFVPLKDGFYSFRAQTD